MKAFLMRIFVLVISIFLAIQVWIFASLLWWKDQPVESTMFMRLYYWTEPDAKLYHQWVDDEDSSNHFKQAVITIEDGHFLSHQGFDWQGIENAFKKNMKKGTVVAGGSTISQQLSKNLFLTNHRSYLRKGQEAIATWMMEQLWSKHRILDVYVNSVELGRGIYGIEAAAQHYFGVSAKHLTREQAIKLAAMLPNPRYYQQHPKDKRLKHRQAMIHKYIHDTRLPRPNE